MNTREFREAGHRVVDLLSDYRNYITIAKRLCSERQYTQHIRLCSPIYIVFSEIYRKDS
jgi:hypothetical protein